MDDDILEGAEDMTFTMSGVVSDADVRIALPSTITVNILDNDGQLGNLKYTRFIHTTVYCSWRSFGCFSCSSCH